MRVIETSIYYNYNIVNQVFKARFSNWNRMEEKNLTYQANKAKNHALSQTTQ